MSKPSLVILSTNFGTDFSGGSRATCEVFNRIQDQFREIVFVGSKVGKHEIKKLTFYHSSNWIQTFFLLKKLKKSYNLFYGDFYNSFLLALAGVRYVFTYHDNWPELGELSFRQRVYGFFYQLAYACAFKYADKLVTVSEFKKKSMANLTKRPVEVIYNGFESAERAADKGLRSGVLMVGNIDQRKYKLAIELFNSIRDEQIQIDIYGHLLDKKLGDTLKQFPFVRLKGFSEHVPYHQYQVLLHTSFIESFGMVFLEAIDQGTPVLAFKRGGADEIVGMGNGMLIEPYQIDQMRMSLLRMLNTQEQIDADFLKSFSWDKAAASYQKILVL